MFMTGASILNKAAMGPAQMSRNLMLARQRGLGALTSGFGPPVGAGAGAGAAIGASQGASIGSAIVPGVGTAIGAIVGAIGGAIAGAMGKKDPEEYNFDQAVSVWQQNPDSIYNIGNKYLPLAGLFDISFKGTPKIPIYAQYGRMGEQRFVSDLVRLLYNAGQQGQINANDTPITVMNRIVQPWINGFNKGPLVDPHADLINRLIIGMIMDYVTGAWRHEWYARGGDFPFSSLPDFVLASGQATPAPQPNVSAAPALPAPSQLMPPMVIAPPPIISPGYAIPPPISTATIAPTNTGTAYVQTNPYALQPAASALSTATTAAVPVPTAAPVSANTSSGYPVAPVSTGGGGGGGTYYAPSPSGGVPAAGPVAAGVTGAGLSSIPGWVWVAAAAAFALAVPLMGRPPRQRNRS